MQSQQNRREPASVGIDKRIHDRLPFDRRITITACHSDGPLYFWGRTSDLLSLIDVIRNSNPQWKPYL